MRSITRGLAGKGAFRLPWQRLLTPRLKVRFGYKASRLLWLVPAVIFWPKREKMVNRAQVKGRKIMARWRFQGKIFLEDSSKTLCNRLPRCEDLWVLILIGTSRTPAQNAPILSVTVLARESSDFDKTYTVGELTWQGIRPCTSLASEFLLGRVGGYHQ